MALFTIKILLLLIFLLIHDKALAQLTSVSGKEQCHISNTTIATEGKPLTGEGDCIDTHEMCAFWAEEGECEVNDGYMLEACPCSCNACPVYIRNEWDDEAQMASGPLKEEIEYIIHRTEEYMKRYKRYFSVPNKPLYCRNKHKGCSHWSLLGECDVNKDFMRGDCGPACRTCHKTTSTTSRTQ